MRRPMRFTMHRTLSLAARAAIGLAALAAAALPGPAAAQDAEALRRELEQMRQQFESMRQGYEKAINDLSDRLKKIESAPPPAAVAAPAPAPAPAPSVAAPAPPAPSGGFPSAMDLARPRQPFALYDRRGPGQLLLDVGVAGDFVGNLTQKNVQQAQGGTFAGLENTFFPREIELSLFGQVDPYARAEMRIEAGQEERGGEIAVHLAEANLTLMALPFNTQAKLGMMRNRFGLLNQVHDHDLPFIDRPDVLRLYLGDEGLVEKGAEVTWVPPLPFYLELLGGLFNGENETAFGLGSIKYPLVTGRARTFFELGSLGAVQLGMSVANGLQPDRLNNLILGWDAKYKLTPEGWQRPFLTVGGELLYQMRRVNTPGTEATVDDDGEEIPGTPGKKQTLHRVGWYAWGEVQPFRFGWLSRFAGGFRYDWTEYPTTAGRQWAAQPYLTFAPSEFLRFRLGYKHTDGNTAGCCSLTGAGSARVKDEWFFQSTFLLGAHPSHPF